MRALLHGFLGAPEAWAEVLGALGDRGAACPTLPGHGTAPWMPAGDFVGAVDALVAQVLPREPVTLVGYSLGARVALSVAMRHPSRVARAVLVGVAPGLSDAREREARVLADEAIASGILRGGVGAFVDAWEALPLFDTQRALPPERLAPQRAWRTAHTAAGLAWALRTLGLGRQPAYREAIRESRVPLHLVTGALDERFTALARDMARLREGVTHTVVAGVGHNVVLEAPEALAALLR